MTSTAGWTDVEIARNFLLRAIQSWGLSQEDRDEAERLFVEAAGFAHNTPASKAFVLETVRNLYRGEFNNEVDQLAAALAAAKTGSA